MDDRVPLFPPWASELAPLLLIPAVIVLLVILAIGTDYGAADGWTLLFSVACGVAVLAGYSYIRRREAREAQTHRALLAEIKIGLVDQLTWQDLERDCIPILQARGYKDVRQTRNIDPDKGVDITAVSPDERTRVAVECKYRGKDSIGATEIKKLIGDISVSPYKDWDGMLITNAKVSREAQRIADEHPRITLVDRKLLAEWLAEEEQGTCKIGNSASA